MLKQCEIWVEQPRRFIARNINNKQTQFSTIHEDIVNSKVYNCVSCIIIIFALSLYCIMLHVVLLENDKRY